MKVKWTRENILNFSVRVGVVLTGVLMIAFAVMADGPARQWLAVPILATQAITVLAVFVLTSMRRH